MTDRELSELLDREAAELVAGWPPFDDRQAEVVRRVLATMARQDAA